jgi:hypothetical protein
MAALGRCWIGDPCAVPGRAGLDPAGRHLYLLLPPLGRALDQAAAPADNGHEAGSSNKWRERRSTFYFRILAGDTDVRTTGQTCFLRGHNPILMDSYGNAAAFLTDPAERAVMIFDQVCSIKRHIGKHLNEV